MHWISKITSNGRKIIITNKAIVIILIHQRIFGTSALMAGSCKNICYAHSLNMSIIYLSKYWTYLILIFNFHNSSDFLEVKISLTNNYIFHCSLMWDTYIFFSLILLNSISRFGTQTLSFIIITLLVHLYISCQW